MSLDAIADRLVRLWGPQPEPPWQVVLAAGAVALAVVLARRSWRLARNAITIAHEGGHALMALLTGRRLRGIRLHSDTSGLTLSAGRPTGPGMALTLFAGYVAPSLLGLLGAVLLGGGRITLLLWISLVLLVGLLVMTRNGYGIFALAVTVAGVFAVSWFAAPEVQAAFAYGGVWFLLFGSVKPIGELQRLRRAGRLPQSDADQLAGVTRVPAIVWVALFGLVNLAALLAGAALLVTAAGYSLPT